MIASVGAPAEAGCPVLAGLLQQLDALGDSPSELVERVRVLEVLKRAAEAEQLRVTAAFAAARARKWAAAGVRPVDAKRSAAGELALARREAQDTSRKRVAVAEVIVQDLPRVNRPGMSGDSLV